MRRDWEQIWISAVVFLGAAGLSVLFSAHRGVALERFLFYSAFFYLFLAGLGLPYRSILENIPLWLCIVGAILGMIGVYEYFSLPLRRYLERVFMPGGASFWGPSHASLQSPIIFGCFMVIALICAWIIRNTLKNYLLVSLSLVFIAAISFSASRLAALGLIVALLFRVFYYGRRCLFRNMVFMFSGTALLIFFTLKFPLARNKISQVFINLKPAIISIEQLDLYASRRLSIWRSAFAIWRDNKWLGVGPGVYDRHLPLYKEYGCLIGEGFQHPHNLFLRVFCETGIFGAVFFFVFAYFLAKKIFRHGNKEYAWPVLIFLFFEMFEEFTRDAFPSLILVLITVYAIKAAQEGAARVDAETLASRNY